MQNSENKRETIEQANTAHQPEKKSEHSKSKGQAPTSRRAYKETIRLFIKILVTIFICEAAIMALLYILPLKRGWEIVADPLLLTILGTPILYWFLVRPVWLTLEQLNRDVETLRESENRLKEAQRVGQVGDWEFDVETQEITWSEEVYGLFDRDPAQGPPTIEENMAYYYPEDSKRLQEQVSKAIELGEEFDTDYQLKLPGGKTVYQHGLIRTVKDENGKVIKLYGTVQDITECKRQENLNIILRNLAVKLSAITELDEGLHLCLEAAIEISGMDCGGVYLVDEASGGLDMAFHKGLSPDFVEFVLRYEADSDSVRLVMRGKPVYKQHQRLGVPLDEKKKREGLRAIAVIPMLHKGRIVGCLNIASHTLREVPAWSRMALETIAAQISGTVVRLRAEQALCESEHKFKAIFDAANDGIVLAEPETKKFSTGNKMFCRMLGYSLKEIQDMGVSDIHPEEALPQVIKQFEKQSKSEFTLASNIPVKRKGGSVFYADVNSSLITLEGKTLLMGIFRDITERKKAEGMLKKERAFSENLINTAQTIVLVLDTDGKIVSFNPYMEELSGYRLEEVKGKDWFTTFLPECDYDEIRRIFKKAISDIRTRGNVSSIIRKDGEQRLIEWHDKTLKDDNGNIIGLLATGQDITEHKKADEALRISEQRLSLAHDAAGMGMFDWDIVQDEAVCNERYFRIFGLESQERMLSQENWLAMVYPDDRERAQKEVRNTLEEKASYDTEYRVVWPDMSVKWIRSKAKVFYDNNGKPYRMIGVLVDITERKKAKEALRENEQKLRSIIDHSVEVFYIHDTEHELTYVSPQSEAIFGYTPEEMMVKWTSLTTDNPVNEEGFKLTEKAIKTGEKQDPYLLELRRKNGQLRIIEVDESPVKNEKEQVTAITGAARDVTERKKAKEKLLDYQVQLKSLASQLSLIEERERRRIAIELHDQIGQSLVFSKLKLDELHQSATSSELTKALDEICSNIGKIIQDTRTLTFDLSSPILNEIGIEAAVAEWLDVQIGAKYGIETEFEDDGQQKPLDDDIRAILFRNVRELLVNVIKHAQANKVKVSIRRVNEYIGIDVEDDGKGFDAVEVTSTAAKEAKFGLFSIRERLEQLGGQFEIDSEDGRGSKVTMTAPLKRL